MNDTDTTFPADPSRWREVPEEEAYLDLVRAHERLAGEMAALFKDHGLTEAQYNVLRILYVRGAGGLPMTEIARRLVTRVPDVTRLVDRLEAAGLAGRRRCTEDRRVIWIHPTAAGTEIVQRLEAPLLALVRRQFGGLATDEIGALRALLRRLGGAAG